MSKRSFEAITFVYYFLIAQISMDKEQDTKAYTIDFLLTAKERKKKCAFTMKSSGVFILTE